MSEHNEDILAAEDIQARVDALLKEIEAQTEAVEARMGDGDGDEEPLLGPLGDEGGLAEGELDEQVEKLIEQANPPEEGETAAADAPAEESPKDEAPAVEAPPTDDAGGDEPADEELDGQVAEMLREAESDEGEQTPAAEETPEAPAASPDETEQPAEPAVEPAATEDESPDDTDEGALAKGLAGTGEAPPAEDEPAPESAEASPASSDGLDEELAAEADQTLEGEIEAVELGGEEIAFGDDTDLPETPATASDAGDESDAEASAESADSPEPSPASGSADRGPGLLARVAAALVGALHLLSRPLDRLTARQRDTIGWIALNLLFIAACVWLVILLR